MDHQTFESQLIQLRAAYLDRLARRLEVLADDAQVMARGLAGATDAPRRAIGKQLRHLAGSGGSYGMPEVSTWARGVESAIRDVLASGDDGAEAAALVWAAIPSLEARLAAGPRRAVWPHIEAPTDSGVVLVIDDDPDAQALVGLLLRHVGLERVGAASAAEARACIAEARPSLILIESRLGDECGRALFAELRADGRLVFVPILFLSSAGGPSEVAAGFRLGADDYITKPFEPEPFLARVSARLGRARALMDAAIRDPLTGLYNRRHTDEELARALSNSRRRREPLAVAVCDLDDFKLWNDTRGHAHGDALLKLFAGALVDGVRRVDTTCRWGGEEFLVVLPRCDDLGAVGAMRRVRQLYTDAQAGQSAVMTFSAGVAEALEADDAGSLVARADAALYRAKSEGKNRTAAG